VAHDDLAEQLSLAPSVEKIVPLAGPTVRGPLGVAHLPRFWLKRILGAGGLLADEYRDDYYGANKTVIDGLGLEPEATLAFLTTTPSYPNFELWVRDRATALDDDSIAAVNNALATQLKPPDNAEAARKRVGISDPSERGSALLNALDDWASVHADVVARRGTLVQAIVPAISSQSSGPLGLEHLPRLWLKATLEATGALFDGWRSGSRSPLDVWFAQAVGIDIGATVDHIHGTLPTYVEFETWFQSKARHITPAEIAQHNATMAPSREMNDFVDWDTLHRIVIEHNSVP
jgi:hypothetical protein